MANICTICTNPKVDEINKDIVDGVPIAEIVKKYGLKKSALYRHRQHMGIIVVKPAKQVIEEPIVKHNLNDEFVERAENFKVMLNTFLTEFKRAADAGDIKAMRSLVLPITQLSAEISRIFELKLKFAIEVESAIAGDKVSPEVEQAIQTLLDAEMEAPHDET